MSNSGKKVLGKSLGSVVELARLTDTPTPHLDTVYAVTLLAKNLEQSKPVSTDSHAPPA